MVYHMSVSAVKPEQICVSGTLSFRSQCLCEEIALELVTGMSKTLDRSHMAGSRAGLSSDRFLLCFPLGVSKLPGKKPVATPMRQAGHLLIPEKFVTPKLLSCPKVCAQQMILDPVCENTQRGLCECCRHMQGHRGGSKGVPLTLTGGDPKCFPKEGLN